MEASSKRGRDVAKALQPKLKRWEKLFEYYRRKKLSRAVDHVLAERLSAEKFCVLGLGNT